MTSTSEQLEALLHAYVAERADDTQTVTSMFALLTTTIGFLSIIGFALTHTSDLPAWVIALTPVPPLPFIAFGALLAHIAQIRGLVIDDYEGQIRTLLRQDGRDQDLPAPYGHAILNRRVWQAYYARIVVGISFLALFGLYVAVLLLAYRHAHESEFALALTTLICCSIATLVLIILYIIALNPQRAFERGIRVLGAETPESHHSPGAQAKQPAASAPHEPRSIHLRDSAGEASWSTGMALFVFVIAFATLAIQLHHYRTLLYALAGMELLFAVGFTLYPLRQIWESAAVRWGAGCESRGWFQVALFRATSRWVTIVSLAVGLAFFVVDVLEREDAGVPRWGEYLILSGVTAMGLLTASVSFIHSWKTARALCGIR